VNFTDIVSIFQPAVFIYVLYSTPCLLLKKTAVKVELIVTQIIP